MQVTAFRIQMFKCVLDSGWVPVNPLTVLVGKNESGKTSLLRALHKFNPFHAEPYDLAREWPRGHRDTKDEQQVVCTVRFALGPEEVAKLSEISDGKVDLPEPEVSKNYAGEFEVGFSSGVFPERLHPNDIDAAIQELPAIPAEVGGTFQKTAHELIDEARRFAAEGRFTDLQALCDGTTDRLNQSRSNADVQPQHNNENIYVETVA